MINAFSIYGVPKQHFSHHYGISLPMHKGTFGVETLQIYCFSDCFPSFQCSLMTKSIFLHRMYDIYPTIGNQKRAHILLRNVCFRGERKFLFCRQQLEVLPSETIIAVADCITAASDCTTAVADCTTATADYTFRVGNDKLSTAYIRL